MFYIVLLSIFLMWIIVIKVKGKFSWHPLLSIWFVTLVLTDITDILLSRIFGLYNLHIKLFPDISTDTKHGIFISDAFVVPMMAVIFCYYYAKHKKWWMPVILYAVMVLIEAVFVHFGYIEYIDFDPLYTAALYVIGAVLLTNFADRFVNYSPPINYTFVLFFATYVIMGMPSAFLGGGMELFLWRPGIFKDHIADNWVISITMDAVSGLILCIILSKISSWSLRTYTIIGLGVASITFCLIMHLKGILVYNKWNNALLVLRYSASTIALIFFDKWESRYKRA